MFKNSRLRLLMKLSNITRLAPSLEETPQSKWAIASEITTDTLIDTIKFIQDAETNPPEYEDGVSAESQLKRKSAPRKRVEYDDGDDDGIDDDVLFPAGGPTVRKVIDDKRPKGTRRRRRNKDVAEGEDGLIDQEMEDEAAADRRRKRNEKARARLLTIKSAAFVNEEDDESDAEGDAEFFAREQAIRERASIAAMGGADDRVLKPSHGPGAGPANNSKRKRTTELYDDDDDEEEDDDENGDAGGILQDSDRDNADDNSDEDASDSGSDSDDAVLPAVKPGGKRQLASHNKRRRLSASPDDEDGDDNDMADASSLNGIASATLDLTMGEDPTVSGHDDDDDDVVVPTVTVRKPRAHTGLIIDSSDEE